jgi:5-methylthioadenosine/S-adenosylhomocysteine deaminase
MISALKNCQMILPGRKIGKGDIVIDHASGRIADVILDGSVAEVDNGLDLSGHLVMPGLVNCHCHAPMTLVRGLGGGLPLQRWLEEAIFPVEAKMTDDDVHAGAVWGAMEMLAGGTTCVADMYEHNYQHAFCEVGMRARVCEVGLSFVPGRLEACINATRSWNKWMRDEVKGDVYMDLCIHSEYLTDEAFCRRLAEANKELKRRLHFHCSETKREHEECIARHGKTPIAYLADTGILDNGGYAAHCVWCTDDDFRIMAEHDVSLVHNPTSNMKLGSGFARIARAMELGVNVALGTDGPASNDNLDMFEEMHLASLIHKGVARDPTVLSPWDVIEMATVNGAKALGRDDIGEIAAGKFADLCVVDLDKPHLTPALDIANLVVHSMHASDVVRTLVGGMEFEGPGYGMPKAKANLLAAVKRLNMV